MCVLAQCHAGLQLPAGQQLLQGSKWAHDGKSLPLLDPPASYQFKDISQSDRSSDSGAGHRAANWHTRRIKRTGWLN